MTEQKLTLDQFIRDGISQIMVAAAETTASLADNPDDAAGIPLVFFGIEEKLLATWQAEYERLFTPKSKEEPPND